MNEKRQILWLDAVKGIACWVVFLGHFNKAYGYLPFVYRWVWSDEYTSFVMSETTAMNVFYVALSFIAAKIFLETKEDFPIKAGKGIIKRYFRLALPIFLIECIVFVLQKAGLWTSRFEAMPIRDIHFVEILRDSFALCLFHGSANVYFVFWMVNKLFIGYIYVILICAIISFMNRISRYLFVSTLVILLFWQANEYCPVVFGVLLYLMYQDIYDEEGAEKKKNIFRTVAGVALAIASTYFAGLCVQLARRFGSDQYPFFARTWYVYCWIAAILLMTGIVLCSPLLRLLDKKRIASLGKLCFPVFILHPLCIVTFGEYAFRFFDARAVDDVSHGVKAAFFASFVSCALLSVGYVKFIEPWINRLISFLMKIIGR